MVKKFFKYLNTYIESEFLTKLDLLIPLPFIFIYLLYKYEEKILLYNFHLFYVLMTITFMFFSFEISRLNNLIKHKINKKRN